MQLERCLCQRGLLRGLPGHQSLVTPDPWEQVLVLLILCVVTVVSDSHHGFSLSSCVSGVQRLCTALMDLHELFQVCHVLKYFPSIPPPMRASCPLSFQGLTRFLSSFSVSRLRPLSLFKAWSSIPKSSSNKTNISFLKMQQSYSFQVFLPDHNFSSFNSPVAWGGEEAVLSQTGLLHLLSLCQVNYTCRSSA